MVFKNNDETHISEGIFMEAWILQGFAIIGFAITIGLMFILFYIVMCKVNILFNKYYKLQKIKRESKNRFRQPPVAKCYCLYCKYAEYFGDDRCGKCSLWGNDIVIKDNGFCYRADPKK